MAASLILNSTGGLSRVQWPFRLDPRFRVRRPYADIHVDVVTDTFRVAVADSSYDAVAESGPRSASPHRSWDDG